jgi:large subunit ribosomal protein L14e
MNTEILLELGRVVYVNYGPDAGRIGLVVDIVNSRKVIVEGPSLGMTRKAISVKRLELTKFKV